MVNVKIGLEHKNTLKWFNQLHAALQKREKIYNQKWADNDRNLQEDANNVLIAALQSVIKEIQQENAGLKK